MSLRTRLVVSLVATLAVALVIAGVALVGLTRQSLVNRVDQELLTLASTADRIGPLQDLTGGGEAGRRLAVMRLDRRGTIMRSFPSGFANDPDPLPVLPVYPGGIPAEAFGTIATRPALDGSLDYRVVMGQGRAGAVIAVAAPLDGVEEVTRALARTLVLVGGLAILALAATAFVIIRRSLVPLERLERAAQEITAGDLSHRAGIPHDQTEVGRVGTAFDAMLDQIEDSFATQRTALEAKAQSEERLRRFVADASHELRTPLTAVRGYADLYRAGGLSDPAELEAAMTRIGTESRRMGLLVDDLLLLAHLDQGRPLRADPVDLSRVALEVVADARAVDPGRPVDGTIEDGIVVTGDEDRIRQVIGNLLANVRVHTPAATPMEVILRRTSERRGDTLRGDADPADTAPAAEVRVVDHGPGIDPAHGARVFDRFYRADPARSRDRGGSGLGLSIVASITAALGGRIWHEATPGGGATFVVRLPLTGTSQPGPGPSSATGPIV
ncbi:MAG TPA: HAMP domain-containing sensor histidine kinase [Candidatus Limnocylindrales bacterium]|jgi:two-component system OmpR family sensor kinase